MQVGKGTYAPWGRNVLALRELPIVFLQILVGVTGMAAHSVVMMVAGVRRSSGSTGKMAGVIADWESEVSLYGTPLDKFSSFFGSLVSQGLGS